MRYKFTFAVNTILNLSNNSSCYINVAESASGQAEANPVF